MLKYDQPPELPRYANLASIVRRVCEVELGCNAGKEGRLYLALQPIFISVQRADLIGKTVAVLLRACLGPDFLAKTARVGVHLWLADSGESILLIADDGYEYTGEPLMNAVERARSLATQAASRLVWVPARGTVWRIHIAA
jgi:hypothetical protein